MKQEQKGVSLALAVAAALYMLGASDCGTSEEEGAPAGGSGGSVGGVYFKPARHLDRYAIHYDVWTDDQIQLARTFQLVICHSSKMTRDQVRRIQQGVDPADPADDVIVLGYVSVGEDMRTLFVTDEEMKGNPHFVGDGSGPRIDPRGPDADGGSLVGIDPLGAPSNGGTGFASWYLDDNDVDRTGRGDGKPDRNGRFGGCFVNAGDPKWFQALQDMRLADGPYGQMGLREILTLDYGSGLGCDGVFLDTVDTAAPNSFTDASSSNQSEYEWTAGGFRDFMRRLREAWPGKAVLQNRGLFFFNPNNPHYEVTTRALIDFGFFESFRLNSNTYETFNARHYPDNRYNIAPKLMAEANRPDGFQVLSLGYAAGPGISEETLHGRSTEGMATLLEDIRVAEENGFRHHISPEKVRIAPFVRNHSNDSDSEPPRWSSTFNVNSSGGVAAAPTPRVGVQEAAPGPGSVTVRWDVALDKNPVRYALYYAAGTFDIAQATRVVLTPGMGAGYAGGTGPAVYPYEATITGLSPGTTYHFVIRAFDTRGNEEHNTTVLTAAPQ